MIALPCSHCKQPRTPLRRRIYVSQGKCQEVKERGSTKIRDNHVKFFGMNGATLLEVHFSPIWYSITEGQPIERNCVFSEDKIKRVKILAGRLKSKQVRDDFVHVFPGQPELQAQNMTRSDDTRGDGVGLESPVELNFAFGGIMNFTFAQANTSFSRMVSLRLAQGHYQGFLYSHNNWWIAGRDCQVLRNDGNLQGLICDAQGGGQVAIKSWKPKADVVGPVDRFRVAPFP